MPLVHGDGDAETDADVDCDTVAETLVDHVSAFSLAVTRCVPSIEYSGEAVAPVRVCVALDCGLTDIETVGEPLKEPDTEPEKDDVEHGEEKGVTLPLPDDDREPVSDTDSVPDPHALADGDADVDCDTLGVTVPVPH